MHPDRDDVRLSERERRAIADLEAAFAEEAIRLTRGQDRPRPKVREWIGPAALVSGGTMLLALATLGSLWLIVLGSMLMVGGVALLATR